MMDKSISRIRFSKTNTPAPSGQEDKEKENNGTAGNNSSSPSLIPRRPVSSTRSPMKRSSTFLSPVTRVMTKVSLEINKLDLLESNPKVLVDSIYCTVSVGKDRQIAFTSSLVTKSGRHNSSVYTFPHNETSLRDISITDFSSRYALISVYAQEKGGALLGEASISLAAKPNDAISRHQIIILKDRKRVGEVQYTLSRPVEGFLDDSASEDGDQASATPSPYVRPSSTQFSVDMSPPVSLDLNDVSTTSIRGMMQSPNSPLRARNQLRGNTMTMLTMHNIATHNNHSEHTSSAAKKSYDNEIEQLQTTVIEAVNIPEIPSQDDKVHSQPPCDTEESVGTDGLVESTHVIAPTVESSVEEAQPPLAMESTEEVVEFEPVASSPEQPIICSSGSKDTDNSEVQKAEDLAVKQGTPIAMLLGSPTCEVHTTSPQETTPVATAAIVPLTTDGMNSMAAVPATPSMTVVGSMTAATAEKPTGMVASSSLTQSQSRRRPTTASSSNKNSASRINLRQELQQLISTPYQPQHSSTVNANTGSSSSVDANVHAPGSAPPLPPTTGKRSLASVKQRLSRLQPAEETFSSTLSTPNTSQSDYHNMSTNKLYQRRLQMSSAMSSAPSTISKGINSSNSDCLSQTHSDEHSVFSSQSSVGMISPAVCLLADLDDAVLQDHSFSVVVLQKDGKTSHPLPATDTKEEEEKGLQAKFLSITAAKETETDDKYVEKTEASSHPLHMHWVWMLLVSLACVSVVSQLFFFNSSVQFSNTFLDHTRKEKRQGRTKGSNYVERVLRLPLPTPVDDDHNNLVTTDSSKFHQTATFAHTASVDPVFLQVQLLLLSPPQNNFGGYDGDKEESSLANGICLHWMSYPTAPTTSSSTTSSSNSNHNKTMNSAKNETPVTQEKQKLWTKMKSWFQKFATNLKQKLRWTRLFKLEQRSLSSSSTTMTVVDDNSNTQVRAIEEIGGILRAGDCQSTSFQKQGQGNTWWQLRPLPQSKPSAAGQQSNNNTDNRIQEFQLQYLGSIYPASFFVASSAQQSSWCLSVTRRESTVLRPCHSPKTNGGNHQQVVTHWRLQKNTLIAAISDSDNNDHTTEEQQDASKSFVLQWQWNAHYRTQAISLASLFAENNHNNNNNSYEDENDDVRSNKKEVSVAMTTMWPQAMNAKTTTAAAAAEEEVEEIVEELRWQYQRVDTIIAPAVSQR